MSHISHRYIVRRFTTGSPNDETPWLPNKEMTKPWEDIASIFHHIAGSNTIAVRIAV